MPADSVWLQELSWPAVRTYLDERASPAVLVPIGSTEQHGPHLPLGVDAYQAADLAGGIAEAADVLAAPPIWYGDARHHLGFPGTVALSTETVVAVLRDVYDSLVGHGFATVVTVNGHRVANLPAIETAMDHATADHPDALFAAFDPLRAGRTLHRELREGDPEDGMHGGEFETSFMWARHPGLVDEDAFEPAPHAGFSRFQSGDLVGAGDVVLTGKGRRRPEDGHPGHVGDPTRASVEKGERLYEGLVDLGVEFLEDVRRHRDAG